jgi:hypothetical protein
LTSDIVDNVDNVGAVDCDAGNLAPSAVYNVNIVNNVNVSKGWRESTSLPPIVAAFSILERRYPDHVSIVDWQHAVEDGRRFLPRWGKQAEALGWTPDDLFSLAEPPARTHPRYRRLSRLDCTGLIWLLHGRPVVALTADTAAIGTRSGGTLTFYRQRCDPCPV